MPRAVVLNVFRAMCRAVVHAGFMACLLIEENIMARKYIDCREFPSEINCSVALSADSEKELLEAAAQHAVTVHKHTDSPELRAQLKTLFHDGTPSVESPRHA
jgi:predicted small metal-binding protein